MFQEQNKKTLERLKKHEENNTSIINDKISSINQRLDKLSLDINNNPTIINKVRSKTSDLTLSLETSQNIRETENKKLKEDLTNLRSDLKEKDFYLKNKLRILEDKSRRKNIHVKGIPGSENKGWDVTEEKLKKVIKACVCYFLTNFYLSPNDSPSKNYVRCFLFHLKISFCS